MILESANSARAVGWHLIAPQGETTVRVRSGMALGEDTAGELSLNSKEPLVEFALADDGGLLVTAVSSIYELQVAQQAKPTRSLHLSPETSAQITFGNNILAIDTDFMRAARSHDTLEIRILRTNPLGTIPAAITKLMAGQDRPPEQLDGEILVPEAGIARQPLQAASDFVRRKLAALSQPQSFSTSSGVFAGVVMATLIVGGLYLTNPERSRIQQAEPRTEPTMVATPVAMPKIAPSAKVLQPESVNPALVSAPARSTVTETDMPREVTLTTAPIPEPSTEAAPVLANGPVATNGPVAAPARGAARDTPANTTTVREPSQDSTRDASHEPLDPSPTGVEDGVKTLALAAPQTRSADQAVPLWERSPLSETTPQPASAPTPATAAKTPGMLSSRAATPALYPLAQLTAIRRDPPAYPRIAPDGAEGSVDVVMTVTKTGAVENIEVRGNAPDYFVRSVTRAVERWRFRPVLENGKPVAVRTSVRLTFRS